jgi:hypothetical protein
MINRLLGIVTSAAMIVAMVALIRRDIVPYWTAGDPPTPGPQTLKPGERQVVQFGIYDERQQLVGRSWTESVRIGERGSIQSFTDTVLEPIVIPLPGGVVETPRVHIEIDVSYEQNKRVVDGLDCEIHGIGLPISLHAEALPTGEFPCQWQVGDRIGSIVLDSEAPAALGDVIRPFNRLPNLYVGQSWRHDLLDPLSQVISQIVPGFNAEGVNLEPILIKVTGRERIERRDHGEVRAVNAFVVEGGDVKAWVADDGQTIKQEVNLPILGRWTVILEDACSCPEWSDSCCRELRSLREETTRLLGVGPRSRDGRRGSPSDQLP